MSYIDLAQKEGGTILTGGKKAETRPVGSVPEKYSISSGFFIEPTIIEGLSCGCRTNQEEIFGPVVTIMPFDTEDEVLSYANSVRYGLSADRLDRKPLPCPPCRRSNGIRHHLGQLLAPPRSANPIRRRKRQRHGPRRWIRGVEVFYGREERLHKNMMLATQNRTTRVSRRRDAQPQINVTISSPECY